MGWIKIKLDVNSKDTKVDVKSNEPNLHDLSTAIAQLEIVKVRLLAKVSQMNSIEI